jgi:hypothetical protein
MLLLPGILVLSMPLAVMVRVLTTLPLSTTGNCNQSPSGP